MLQQHKVFMSVGHDEYWSGDQRANVEAARDAGVHLAFFSGNEVFWKTRWEPSIDGTTTVVPHARLVQGDARATPRSTPIPAWTGTWRDPLGAADRRRPARERADRHDLHGQLLHVRDAGSGRATGSCGFWRNTQRREPRRARRPRSPDGTLGYEWDEDLDNGSRPAGQIDLSSTTVNVPERIQRPGSTYAPGTATHSVTMHRARERRARVRRRAPSSGRGGWTAPTTAAARRPTPAMRQATVNLFADMGVQPGDACRPASSAATASTDTRRADRDVGPRPASGHRARRHARRRSPARPRDTGGGRVGGVEVSTDGGATWHPASGRDAWSYTFTPRTPGTLSIRSRATDDSVNTGAGLGRRSP